mgnify:CR=1 FL=1
MILTVVDIETTGFDKEQDDIIQFAYLQMASTGKFIRQEILYFYYPGTVHNWSKEAEEVHGIHLSSLEKYKDDFEKNCMKMWITMFKSNCVTFNGDRFDIPFIHSWLRRVGYPVNNITDVPIKTYDVYKIMKLHGVGCKLIKAPERLGVNPDFIPKLTSIWSGNMNTRAHLAQYDAVATWLCLLALKNKHWVSFDDTESDTTVTSENPLGDFNNETKVGQVTYTLQDSKGNYYTVVLVENVPSVSTFIKECKEPQNVVFVQESENRYVYGNLVITIEEHNIKLDIKR